MVAQPKRSECCGDAVADAIEHCLEDFSEGSCDPELAGYLTAAVLAALDEHVHTGRPAHLRLPARDASG